MLSMVVAPASQKAGRPKVSSVFSLCAALSERNFPDELCLPVPPARRKGHC